MCGGETWHDVQLRYVGEGKMGEEAGEYNDIFGVSM